MVFRLLEKVFKKLNLNLLMPPFPFHANLFPILLSHHPPGWGKLLISPKVAYFKILFPSAEFGEEAMKTSPVRAY